jgi:hypothetical protein
MKTFVCLGLVAILVGCKTQERIVQVETARTDTTFITRQQRDSIWLHDSVFVREKMSGDTLYLLRDRWRTKFVERTQHDTIYIASHDTIPRPYPVEVEVEKPLSWWQRFRLHLGTAILLVLGGGVVWRIARWGR